MTEREMWSVYVLICSIGSAIGFIGLPFSYLIYMFKLRKVSHLKRKSSGLKMGKNSPFPIAPESVVKNARFYKLNCEFTKCIIAF